MRRNQSALPPAPPPYIPLHDLVSVDRAEVGDMVFFNSHCQKNHGYRCGVVAPYKKKRPPGTMAIRINKPNDKLGPVQLVPLSDIVHVFKPVKI